MPTLFQVVPTVPENPFDGVTEIVTLFPVVAPGSMLIVPPPSLPVDVGYSLTVIRPGRRIMITPTMPKSPNAQQAVPLKRIWALLLGSLALIPLSMALGWFDTTTQLIPTHEKVDQACLAIAALCGLLACGAGIYLTATLTIIQRIMLPLVIMLEAAIGIFLVANHTASIVEGWLDFPAGKTHARQALFVISRAYQTHGKGSSQYIQTMPIWSNLEITREDFAFMNNNRRPGDDDHNPDEISSRGHFCAKLTIEQSDKALRILHAGSKKLPEGTVILCPVVTRAP
jgi:hypothetical protein